MRCRTRLGPTPRHRGARPTRRLLLLRLTPAPPPSPGYREFEYCRIDGSTSGEARDEQMNAFNEPGSKVTAPARRPSHRHHAHQAPSPPPPSPAPHRPHPSSPQIFIFMLSTRAGGLGINLQVTGCNCHHHCLLLHHRQLRLTSSTTPSADGGHRRALRLGLEPADGPAGDGPRPPHRADAAGAQRLAARTEEGAAPASHHASPPRPALAAGARVPLHDERHRRGDDHRARAAEAVRDASRTHTAAGSARPTPPPPHPAPSPTGTSTPP